VVISGEGWDGSSRQKSETFDLAYINELIEPSLMMEQITNKLNQSFEIKTNDLEIIKKNEFNQI